MKDDLKNITFCEVNQKIAKIQENYLFQMNWERDNKSEIIDIDTNRWSDADEIAEGGKYRAIENITNNVPSNSIVFYAPAGSKIDKHSHQQMEFCICLSGKLKFVLMNNEHYLLEPIESIYVQPNEIHEVQFIEDSQIIVTWNPKLKL